MLYRLSYEDSPEAGPVRVQFIPVIFHFHSLSAVHSYDLYHIYIMLFSSYNGYKLNSYLICFVAQSVEPRTGVAEVMGSNPVGASEFFLGFICNCLGYFTTAKISFASILYPQFTRMIFIIYTSYEREFAIYRNGFGNASDYWQRFS